MSFGGLVRSSKWTEQPDGGDPGTDADAVSKAKVLMRTALAGKLVEAGLP
jgi:hypothetical protein